MSVDHPNALSRAIYYATKQSFHGLFLGWNRIRIVNSSVVPKGNGVIMAATHRSFLDIGAMAVASPRMSKFLAKRSLFKYALPAAYFRLYGAFPVSRESADRPAITMCINLLKSGEAVTIFPEGSIVRTDTVGEIYSGVAFIALKAQCPIVPVGIAGTEQSMGRGMRWPRPSKIVVEFGDAIDVSKYAELPRRDALDALTADLQQGMQQAFDSANAKR